MNMLRSFLLAVALVLCPMTNLAQAQDRFLFIGDSIFAAGVDTWTDVGALFAKKHPELGGFCRSAVPGRTTQGLAGVDFLMAYCGQSGKYPVRKVFILLGINNLRLLVPYSAEQTATELRAIAARVVANGGTPYILTLTPAFNDTSFPKGNVYGRDVSMWLYLMNGVGPYYPVINARDKFTGVNWRTCATDGVHPDGILCRQTIADAISEALLSL